MLNHLLPPGGQFHAVVNGRPTSLAGCTRFADCTRRDCLRRADVLLYRANLALPSVQDCRAYIPSHLIGA